MKFTDFKTGNLSEFDSIYHDVSIDYDVDVLPFFEEENEDDSEIVQSHYFFQGKFFFEGYNYAIIAADDFSSDGIYKVAREIEDERLERSVTLFGSEERQAQVVAIHENKESTRVVDTIELNKLKTSIQQRFVSGELYGLYYNECGTLCAEVNGEEDCINVLRY